MLSIGEFSNICRVSTKTLRYYAEIGLLLPSEVNPENGYRYYAIEQLETMLFINHLKAYHFSLDEIGDILKSDSLEEQLYTALSKKKQELEWQVQNTHNTLLQINTDMKALLQGKSIMSFMEDMDVTLVDVSMMYLLSSRKDVLKNDYETEYIKCFGLVLVYKCGQEKLNNLYYQMKEQRRCSTWRKIKNLTLRNLNSRSWICIMPEEPRIHNWNVNMA